MPNRRLQWTPSPAPPPTARRSTSGRSIATRCGRVLPHPQLSCRSCRPTPAFAELVRLSPMSIVDEIREEHGRRLRKP